MTVTKAKKLKEGDRVQWVSGDLGTVTEVSYAAIKIHWDDDQWALLQFAGQDVPWRNVERVKP